MNSSFGLGDRLVPDIGIVPGNISYVYTVVRVVPDIRTFLYPVSDRISGFIYRISGLTFNK